MKILYRYRGIILVSILFAGLLCLVFKDVIFSDYIFARRDIARLYLPVREFVVNSIKAYEAPLWNPYIFCGMPLHASIHHAVFYPLTLIYYIGDFTKGFSFFIIFHIFLCGIFTYLFSRAIKVSRLGSALAGFAFMFSGYIISTICLTTVLSSVTWFPLVMLFFLKALQERRYIYSLALGFTLSLMFIAGDPPAFIVTSFLLFCVSAYLFFKNLYKNKRADTFIIYSIFITTALFLLLTAFQTIPALEYYSNSIRTDMSWHEASAWSLPYEHLLSFIIPYFNEPAFFSDYVLEGQKWLDNYYLGIITIALALIGIFYKRRSSNTRFLVSIAIFSIAVSLGRNFIFFPILFKTVPGFNLIRYPVRFIFIFTFAACALSGIGFDALKGALNSGKGKRIGLFLLTAGFLSALSAIALMVSHHKITAFIMAHFDGFFHSDSSFVYADIFNLRRTFIYMAVFGLFVFLCSRTKRKNAVILPIFLLMGFDILFTNTDYNFIVDREYFKSPTENIDYIMRDKSLFRILASPYSHGRFSLIRGESLHDAINTSKDFLVNNRMMEFGIYDAWGYDSSKLDSNHKTAALIYNSKMPNDTNLLNLLNIKYISSHDDLSCYGYRKVHKTDNAAVYENTRCLPRAALLREVICFENDKETLDYMSSRRFNPKKEILFTKSSLPEYAAELDRSKRVSGAREDGVEIIEYLPRHIKIDVCAKKEAFLLLSDTCYPGWNAYIDGNRTDIYCADFFLRAVKVPAGRYKVEFIYNPAGFRIGYLISLAGFIIFIYTLIRTFKVDRYKNIKYNKSK